jgi:hypothetical protein
MLQPSSQAVDLKADRHFGEGQPLQQWAGSRTHALLSQVTRSCAKGVWAFTLTDVAQLGIATLFELPLLKGGG